MQVLGPDEAIEPHDLPDAVHPGSHGFRALVLNRGELFSVVDKARVVSVFVDEGSHDRGAGGVDAVDLSAGGSHIELGVMAVRVFEVEVSGVVAGEADDAPGSADSDSGAEECSRRLDQHAFIAFQSKSLEGAVDLDLSDDDAGVVDCEGRGGIGVGITDGGKRLSIHVVNETYSA